MICITTAYNNGKKYTKDIAYNIVFKSIHKLCKKLRHKLEKIKSKITVK